MNLRRINFILACCLLMSFGLIDFARSYDPKDKPLLAHETPRELKGIGVTEHLGRQLDLSLPFTADDGSAVTLGQYLNGEKPVLLTMVYYACPSLCNYHLNGLLDVFKKMNLVAGVDFRVVAVSMDHREGPDLAGPKKESYVNEYGHPEAQNGWHFLTGTEENVKKLADQLGFSFRWDEEGQQYAHASVAYVVTPKGKLSRYLYGIEFPPQTLKLAMIEASNGQIGSVVDQLIFYCFQFDPAKNKYTLYAFRVMQIGGLLTVLVLAIVLLPVWLREKRGMV